MNKLDKWKESNSSFDFNEQLIIQQMKRSKQKVFFKRLLQTCACALSLIFVLTNTSPAYIQATKDIPLLNKLNDLLNFNPSVNNAIENDYIQNVNVTKEKDGLLVEVDQVIVDEKEIYVFYNVTYNGKELERDDYTINYPNMKQGSRMMDHYIRGEYHISCDEVENTSTLIDDYSLTFNYKGISLEVDIPIDDNRIAKHKTYEINNTIEINGQIIHIEKIDVYPLATRIYLSEDENNECLIDMIKFKLLIDGEEVKGKSLISFNGVYYLESPYFLDETCDIVFESARLIKKPGFTTLNIETGEYDDPTGLTYLIEYNDKYKGNFEHGDEVHYLDTEVVIGSKDSNAIKQAQFIMTWSDTGPLTTWTIDVNEDKTEVQNRFRFYVGRGQNDEVKLVEFKSFVGETIQVNKKVKLK